MLGHKGGKGTQWNHAVRVVTDQIEVADNITSQLYLEVVHPPLRRAIGIFTIGWPDFTMISTTKQRIQYVTHKKNDVETNQWSKERDIEYTSQSKISTPRYINMFISQVTHLKL